MTEPEPINQPAATEPPGVPGHYVILGIFGLAILMTASLWIYWDWHTAPFRPLQIAIAEEFPKSEPRVQGGQRKIHKETPQILRIVMRVDFNPLSLDNQKRLEDISQTVFAVSEKHQDLKTYDIFELHFFKMKPEDLADQITLSLDMNELLKGDDVRATTIASAVRTVQEPKSQEP